MYLSDDQEELMDAVIDDDTEAAERLLKKGIDPDFERHNDGSPLEAAIRNGNLRLVWGLIDAGADVNRSSSFNDRMLDIADREGHRRIIGLLEQHGAVSSRPNRLTLDQKSLLNAVALRNLDRVEDLLYDGLSPDFADDDGATPLEHAVFARDPRIVAALAEAGGDITRPTASGESLLDLARGQGLSTIARYLENERAKAALISGKNSGRSADPNDDYYDDDLYYFGADEGYRPSRQGKAAAPKGPVFSEKTLPDIFKVQKWIGKPDEMEALWDKVPKQLQKHFDFAAAKAEARREMLKQNRPKSFKPVK